MTLSASQDNALAPLNRALQDSLVLTPAEHGATLIRQKWGDDVDPVTTQLVTLDYDYHGHPLINGVHQGQIRFRQSLVQALLSDYQAVADDRFGETAFGFYTPPAVGPEIKIVKNVDEFAYVGSGNHRDYEGIYRRSDPQTYGPSTQLAITAADYKKWVWLLEYKELYQDYLDRTLPSDAVMMGSAPYPLRTSMKTAFVMVAFLQRLESSLTLAGLQLALSAAGLGDNEVEFSAIDKNQLEQRTHPAAHVEVSRLMIYRYTACDIWVLRHRVSAMVLLYVPGNSSPLHQFADIKALRAWIVEQGKVREKRTALAEHFAKDDRIDGTFHAGVLTALEAMAEYPRQHHLTRDSGFFNNDGYWNPDDYITLDIVPNSVDPFAELVKVFKQTSLTTAQEAIRDDADVNRDNLAAVVNPVVGWLNRWGALAIFFPGGEGLLGLAGLIQAAQGVSEILDAEGRDQVNEGVTRTVFGLLNALPLLIKGGTGLADSVSEPPREPAVSDKTPAEPEAQEKPGGQSSTPQPEPHDVFIPPGAEGVPISQWTRPQLMRGFGRAVEGLSDERLELIRQVSGVTDEQLRLQLTTGARPQGLLADTLLRFNITQRVEAYIVQLGSSELPLSDMHRLRWLTTDKAWPADVGLRLKEGDRIIWETGTTVARGDVLTIETKSPFFQSLARRLSEQDTRRLLGELLRPEAPYPSIYVRARLLRLKAQAIVREQRVSMFERYYQNVTSPQSDLQKALGHEYPSLASSILDQLLASQQLSPDSTLTLGQIKALLQRLEPQVAASEQELRLARAYEGVYLNTVRNADSDTLLLHSAQRMQGWSPRLSITVREGAANGAVLDRIGAPSLAEQRTIIQEGNLYKCPDSVLQRGYTTDDFADAILHNLSNAELTQMGVRTDSLEHFKFMLRRNILGRRDLETVLRRQQLRTPFFEPEEGGLRGGAGGVPREVLQTDRMLVDSYIPGFTEQQVSEFMGCFDWPGDAQAELQRIKDSEADLEVCLQDWLREDVLEDDYYASLDDSEAEIDEQDKQAWMDRERVSRNDMNEKLRQLYTWRGPDSLKVYRDGRMVGFKFMFDATPEGGFPRLNPGRLPNAPFVERFVEFNSVVELSKPAAIHRLELHLYLGCFPRLDTLELQGIPDALIPADVAKMSRLRDLKLTDGALQMVPDNNALLGKLTTLESLDLSGNPLGAAPSIDTLPKLRSLRLDRTGLVDIPRALVNRRSLEFLGLAGNRFTSIPRTLDLRWGLDLSANPFDDLNTLQRLFAFRQETGFELWIDTSAAPLNQPDDWVRGLLEPDAVARTALWQKVAAQERGADPRIPGYLSRFARMSMTLDYRVGYEGLRNRLWVFLKRVAYADEPLRIRLRGINQDLAQTENPRVLLESLEQGILNYDALRQGHPMFQLPKRARLE